jgi:hypothetical protein
MPQLESIPADRLDGLLAELDRLAATKIEPSNKLLQSPPMPGRDNLPLALRRADEIPQLSPARAAAPAETSQTSAAFFPAAPRSAMEIGIPEGEIEAVIVKLLALRTSLSGRNIAAQIGLPFPLTEPLLHSLKAQRLVVFKSTTNVNDYVYDLTELGLKCAQELRRICTYCGAVPVPLDQYVASVSAQSLQRVPPQLDDLKRSLADLTLSDDMCARLLRAVISGRGAFLYGEPGNGKTSIAARICAAYGTSIWIPRAISVFGEIIRVYDPSCHQLVSDFSAERLISEDAADMRWVRIRRPTIVAGGELTLDRLELKADDQTGVSEAPIQMKCNCGVLVIDDFGRQRVSPVELLNRWIVPLEERIDYLSLPSGRKIAVPFDQFPVFATNLEPKDLVDEAFLRRIPYKIHVTNPTEDQFRQLWIQTCKKYGMTQDEASFEHLIATHYRQTGRGMRFCHSRDLVQQVAIYCKALRTRPALSIPAIDAAAADYFSMV